MITTILSIVGLAALFAVFGLMRHRPESCGGGSCGSCGSETCNYSESNHEHV